MTVHRADVRWHFWGTFIDTARHNPTALEFVTILMVFYLHLGKFAQCVIEELDRRIDAIDGACAENLNPGSPMQSEAPFKGDASMPDLAICSDV